MPITTEVVSSNPDQAWCTCTLCDKVCQWLAAGRLFSLRTPVSSTNKTGRHDITKILLKVALNTITLILFFKVNIFCINFYLAYLGLRLHLELFSNHNFNWQFCKMWLATGRWFSPGTMGSAINKIDLHDINEILLKVTLNTITLTLFFKVNISINFYLTCYKWLKVTFRMVFLPQFQLSFLQNIPWLT